MSYTKLEQAGSGSDHRPKIYELFRDLPTSTEYGTKIYSILESLVSASSNVQKISAWHNFGHGWREWSKNPKRTRVILLKGGPGQGKSTIGQYFAQIQRAAFILSDDGPRVTPQIKEIANELKLKAEEDGFWPSVPRIPLFIELKDYANWYIGKDEQSPKNILEYICYKINDRTSFEVNAYILRESLLLSSWFVNFDGLDEVPNDLKDRIANEIIQFTNELVPNIDADVLILCSTRPQGYSGQFDNLDASICNLLPLPKSVALSCAEAVIKFNRSDEESEQSLKILQAAMASEQVKELMTTPLQSHIMAVVVRDGGRPPEKRWELFNNFYTVMKKRESLKDFPDPRIAVLLREKEQLLKAIHDRLGICLHVKAEYSRGAEASLNKNEFKTLAEQTTAILMDGDIKDTVDTLMEATIERLVFVNTPDSSDHVRFDIRQLQEFFAAEFINNAFDDAEFQTRFEIICGDAHWREVTHFILSALSHYKKFSALLIASTILQQLDDDDNYKMRIYKKRRATGSLLTLRLIEEGVLEQDKRIRNLFTKNLTSLWGLVDSDILTRISSIKMEQSRNWLLNSMIESFLELDYSESIACGHLFSIMLPSDHERINEIKDRLNKAPDSYWISVLSIFEIEFVHSSKYLFKPWFTILLINKFFSKDTHNDVLIRINNYFSRYRQVFKEVIDELDCPIHYKEFIKSLILDEVSFQENSENEKYCFVSIIPFRYDWSNCDSISVDADLFSEETFSYPVELFKETYFLHQERTPERLRRIVALIINNEYNHAAIPAGILSMIPLRFDDIYFKKDCQRLVNSSDAYILNYLQTKKIDGLDIIPECRYITANQSTFEKSKWNSLCQDYPEVALKLSVASFFNIDEMNLSMEKHEHDYFKPILTLAMQYTDEFSKFFFIFGDLFRVFPEHSSQLKRALLKNPVTKPFSIHTRHFRISTFKIDLEHEKPFITSLAFSLTTYQPLKYIKLTGPEMPSDSIIDESFFKKFGLNNEILLRICLDSNEDALLRASSLTLLLIQKSHDKSKMVEEFFEKSLDKLFFTLFDKSSQKLLTCSIYQFLNDVIDIDVRLMEFLGNFSNHTKNNYDSRDLIQNIYVKWRERAGSVVHNSEQLNHWLMN